jgi:glutaredoxin
MDTDPNDFEKPSKNEYTVYSKSGCPNCNKVKELLKEKQMPFIIIDCDEYLIESKPEFLQFIQNLTCQEWKTFPIVFNSNSQFIGGFLDTKIYLDKLSEQYLDFTDESF